jgi:hypothetical protein
VISMDCPGHFTFDRYREFSSAAGNRVYSSTPRQRRFPARLNERSCIVPWIGPAPSKTMRSSTRPTTTSNAAGQDVLHYAAQQFLGE